MAKKAATPSSDVFTGLLGLATLAVLGTAVYVGLMCMKYFGTLFSIA
ncbi:MAG: hypothetical protein ACYSUT_02610 [Planctomycetota bacterium]|jgi:hypothetical protein